MELFSYNLDAWIRSQKGLYPPQMCPDPTVFYVSEWSDQIEESVSILLQITFGLLHIHNHKLIHRDLNPRNGMTLNIKPDCEVLYSAKQQIWKVADFGITQEGTSRTPLITASSRGTSSYRAPELLTDSPAYTNKVDVFAFGCVVFEIFTGRKRFSSDWEVHKLLQSTETVKATAEVFDASAHGKSCSQLIEGMLNVDWTARPTCEGILEHILKLGSGLLDRATVKWIICQRCLTRMQEVSLP